MTAPWRSPLARALHRNRSKPHSRYLQLATVTPQGYPANRTVVFRGFLDNSDCLKFITDLRSGKITQLQHQPHAEACWYFTKTREQFRLAGTVQIVTETDSDSSLQLARKITWQNISDAARSQFAWSYPGKPLDDRESAFHHNGIVKEDEETRRQGDKENFLKIRQSSSRRDATPESFSVSNPNPDQPLDNFCLLLLTPHKVDHLELRGDRHNRCLYTLQADNTWSIQPVNP